MADSAPPVNLRSPKIPSRPPTGLESYNKFVTTLESRVLVSVCRFKHLEVAPPDSEIEAPMQIEQFIRSHMHGRPEPVQILEAAWCATVDPRYLRFFELPRSQWLGPVEGPLWCAAAWLQPAMSQGYLFPKTVYDALSFLTRLALHVLPDTDRFSPWLQGILARLIGIYPDQPEDPFTDLFDRQVGPRLGPLIGRNTLDPALLPNPMVTRQFLAEALSDTRDMGNPFLADSGDLADVGFVGQPYVLPPDP